MTAPIPSSVCPCDQDPPLRPDNPPGLSRIDFRHGDWRSIRHALLGSREGEDALAAWRPGGTQDLALMVAEWWADLGEVLEFYNDQIANEAFLGTATRPESVSRLVSLLGYRPRPGLGATATLAAIVSGQEALTIPQAFRIESSPAAGQQPQIFEVAAATPVLPGGQIAAQPVPSLVSPETGVVYLEGKPRGIASGDLVRLRSSAGSWLLAVSKAAATADTPVRTRVGWTAKGAVPTSLRAANSKLERPAQLLPVWSLNGTAISGSTVHLAGVSRSVGAGDQVLVTQPGHPPVLASVTATADVIWYANPPGSDPSVAPDKSPVPIPHTVLTLAITLDSSWSATSTRIGVGWIEIGPLSDQQPADWIGTPAQLEAIAPSTFIDASARPVLVADANGIGVPGGLSADAGATTGTFSIDKSYASADPLASPLAVLTQTLGVSRGKSVLRETLGSGDARALNQTFTLAKAPVTYLRSGAGYVSTVTVRVDGIPWQEVASFYGQPATAAIFTLSENEQGKTVLQFGDGVNGRRLPSGASNIVADYRYGSGAQAPGAGRLTRIVSPLTGLSKILNPVAAGGGADPEPANEISLYAPRSVLTFGRAVSVADYQAIAAQAVAPERVRAVWAWDDANQRTAVTVYVAGDAADLTVVRQAFADAGDPNRPVSVQPAQPVRIALTLKLLVSPGYDTDAITAAVAEGLIGDNGLFSPARMGIGDYLFNSAISAAVLAVPGTVTAQCRLSRVDAFIPFFEFFLPFALEMTGSLHRIEENQWFSLAADDLSIQIETSNG